MNREPKARIVHNNSPRGVLVWRLPSGKFLGDADGNYLSLNAVRGDMLAVKRMREAARYYGYPEGETVFLPGRRRVTQSEWEDQMEAFINGDPLPGDPNDDAWKEA